jgi:Tfp pilus assembly protein PilP
VELSERELKSQVYEELQIQFPSESSDWLFDFAPLNAAPPVDGLRTWEVFALASKRMATLHNMCHEKQWRLACVAPLVTLAQAQLGTGVCFYPTRQQRVRQLWRKRCIKGGVGVCVALVMSLGLGSGYSLASAYWSDNTLVPQEIAQLEVPVENTPQHEAWMLKEFERTKEPLEFYGLEDLQLVGFIQQGRHAKALILVKGQQKLGIYNVREGEHLGKNFGRILQITHSAVVLNELHQDDVGVWTERKTSLQLVTDAT